MSNKYGRQENETKILPSVIFSKKGNLCSKKGIPGQIMRIFRAQMPGPPPSWTAFLNFLDQNNCLKYFKRALRAIIARK